MLNDSTRARSLHGRFGLVATWTLLLLVVGSPARARQVTGCDGMLAGETIRFVVPQAPGGGYDTYARLIAPAWSQRLGATMLIDNVVGAGGLVGANVVKNARPDGKTLTILNVSGLLVSSLLGNLNAPHPGRDFTLIGRVSRTQQVWASGSTSGIRTLDDVLRLGRERPVLFGIQDVGATAFSGIVNAAHLLALPWDFVSGYEGTLAMGLGALRGEVDLIGSSFESIRPVIDGGDLVPILQISDEPVSSHPSLEGVPVLGGPDGVAVKLAREQGRDPERALALARTTTTMLDLGRIVAAPLKLDESLRRCLESTLLETLASEEVKQRAAKAERSLDPETGTRVKEALDRVSREAVDVVPRVREAIQRAQR